MEKRYEKLRKQADRILHRAKYSTKGTPLKLKRTWYTDELLAGNTAPGLKYCDIDAKTRLACQVLDKTSADRR